MNRIITDRVKALRALGRQSLKGHWQEAILFTLVCHFIMQAPAFIYNSIDSSFDTLGILASVINIYSVVIAGPITLSLINFYLKVFRQEGTLGFGGIKHGFDYFGKALVLYIRMMLFTWLWSMLFIVPGIIAAISYSQSFYILADDPTKSPAKCMFESKFIMRGNKLKYISMIISFVGWYILASIPAFICHFVMDGKYMDMAKEAMLAAEYSQAAAYITKLNPLVDVLLLITIVVDVYLYSAKVGFFDILVGRMVIKNVEDLGEAEAFN